MRIRGIAKALPSKVVTNSDILALVEENSAIELGASLDRALREIDFYLRFSGSETRKWLDGEETPLGLLRDAVTRALRTAELAKGDIDLVVYTGIGRGFLEPAGAYHAAAALELKDVHCFDILDACMSWTRAVQLVDALFQSGTYQSALVVNAEFCFRPGGIAMPAVFKLPSVDSIKWTFPAYTLGEAATATVLTSDGSDPWRFQFSSRPDLADLCNVPLPGYEGFCVPSERVAKNGVGRFTSYGFELHRFGNEALRVMKELEAPKDEATLLVTHASSRRHWQDLAEQANLKDVLYDIYARTGNVVSASVPAAIASAIEEGSLRHGERVLGWVGSAGMSFGAFSFIY